MTTPRRVIANCYRLLLAIAAPTLSFADSSLTIDGKPATDYLPLLDSTTQRMFNVDPNTGMYVSEIKPNLFLVSDGVFQSAFLKTGKGVIVFDAPPRYAAKLPAIIETHAPNEAVKYLIYSHGHGDHIGGASALSDTPGLHIIAHQHLADTLRNPTGPHTIPAPTTYFNDAHTVSLGEEKVELRYHGNFHAHDADIFIYLPRQRVLYVIDAVGPGYVPFKNLGMTTNPQRYTTLFDDMLLYDFDTFIGGHLNIVGNRQDIFITRDYVRDVAVTSEHIIDTVEPGPLFAEVFSALQRNDNLFLAYSHYLQTLAEKCAEQLIARWKNRLSGVDVWAKSHCSTMQNNMLAER